MKKNLRIVSAAAAALLAVAPIAATAMPVNAAAVNAIAVGGAATPLPNNSDVKISSSVAGVTTKNGLGYTNGRISGSITASYNGTNYSANFKSSDNGVVVATPGKDELSAAEINGIAPGNAVTVTLKDGVSFNFGSANANKTITLSFPKNVSAANLAEANVVKGVKSVDAGKTITVQTDKNGVVSFGTAQVLDVKVVESSDVRVISFYNKETGSIVTNGDLTVNAGTNARVNVQQIVNAFNAKYQAAQLNNSTQSVADVNNTPEAVANMLRAQGITVDSQGYFEAPKTFTLNFVASSSENDSTAKLAVTVNVPNGKETAAAQEVTKNVTIMHVAAIYDKNGKRTSEAKLGAYNSVSVVAEPVTINGAKFYKLAGKDQYIKVGNVDGTVRTLKHNSYKYKSNLKAYTHKVGKKTKKIVVKSGSEVKTYGSAFKMADGKMYYRIDKNTYIKKANF